MSRHGRVCWCKADIKKRLAHFGPQINELINAKSRQRKIILRDANACFLKLLVECALNILKENISVGDDQYKKIRPYKKLLLLMSEPKLSLLRKKKALLNQRGGNPLAVVLGRVLLSVAASYIGDAVTKAASG